MLSDSQQASSGICALYCVYDESYWLPYSVRSIYESVQNIFIFLNSKPWYGPARDQSSTKDCIQSLADAQNKIRVLEGTWNSETEQRNHTLAIAQVSGFKYGFIIDADEVYTAEHVAAMFEYAASRPEVDCWHVRWFTYWKSLRYRIDPPEPYDPAVLIKLGTVGFIETRNPVGAKHDLIPPLVCMCHHLSYAIPDERLKHKHIWFDGHSQSARAGWFENVWKRWDSDHNLNNLHPNNPSQFQRAVLQSPELIPPVLQEAYLKGGLL